MEFDKILWVDGHWYEVNGIWTPGDPGTWHCAWGDPARKDDEIERIEYVYPVGVDQDTRANIERDLLRKLRADLDREIEECSIEARP